MTKTKHEIIAGLIHHVLKQQGLHRTERIVISRYSAEEARKIVEALLSLSDCESDEIQFTEYQDDGGEQTRSVTGVTFEDRNSKTLEVVPYVVRGERAAADPRWLGTQGYSTLLRTDFDKSKHDVIRVLLLFDKSPVETGRTTSSQQLEHDIDSLDSLLQWIREDSSWGDAFTNIDAFKYGFELKGGLADWWISRLREPGWYETTHGERLEALVRFWEACKPVTTVGELGAHLPILGPLFSDELGVKHALTNAKSNTDKHRLQALQKTLNENAKTAWKLHNLSNQRTMAPIEALSVELVLEPEDEDFYQAIAAAVDDPEKKITDADGVTRSEIEKRLRSRKDQPAYMDLDGATFIALDEHGDELTQPDEHGHVVPVGPLEWSYLGNYDHETEREFGEDDELHPIESPIESDRVSDNDSSVDDDGDEQIEDAAQSFRPEMFPPTAKHDPYEIVVGYPPGCHTVRMTVPTAGDENEKGYVYQDDDFEPNAGSGGNGALLPPTSIRSEHTASDPVECTEENLPDSEEPVGVIHIRIEDENPFVATELKIRPKPDKRSRATQTIRIGVNKGPSVVVPDEATIEVASDPSSESALLVDGDAADIRVRVSQEIIRVDDEDRLPPPIPEDDDQEPEARIIEFENGSATRWKGQDLAPVDTSQTELTSNKVRLLDLWGIRQDGDRSGGKLVFDTKEQVWGIQLRTTARLEVERQLLEQEAALIRTPELFVLANCSDLAARARTKLEREVPAQFEAWLQARIEFFNQLRESCKTRSPKHGDDHPSVYLVDFCNDAEPELLDAAARYVDRYNELLSALLDITRGQSQATLIEPILFCDRGKEENDWLSIAPTHPMSVAFYVMLQRGLLNQDWPSFDEPEGKERKYLEDLASKPLLRDVLPHVKWGEEDFHSSRDKGLPLLWRKYGVTGSEADSNSELTGVITAKVKRLIAMSPHLNHLSQTLLIDVEVGADAGTQYLVDAIKELTNTKAKHRLECRLDIGVVLPEGSQDTRIRTLFLGRPKIEDEGLRAQLQGQVRVRTLSELGTRDTHLTFRPDTAPGTSELNEHISYETPLIRDTGFAGGLWHERARYTETEADQVLHRSYVNTQRDDDHPELESSPAASSDATGDESPWSGPWHERFRELAQSSRQLSIGLASSVGSEAIPCQQVRQQVTLNQNQEYERSFITVHCDPAQGPEFFSGKRAENSQLFLVESSDRGKPTLPGRDVVSVTSRIKPFEHALKTAVSGLPTELSDKVNEEVSKHLLADINLLRGTQVFDFLREISRHDKRYLLDGLDNVFAMRFLLSVQGRTGELADCLPIVISLNDLTARSKPLESLSPRRSGTGCDDILVLYVPTAGKWEGVIAYRLVEVKFGDDTLKKKARKQLENTSRKLQSLLPHGMWCDDTKPSSLLVQRDLTWILHETLERYRAFGVFSDTTAEDLETRWGFKALFAKLNRGEFQLKPGGFDGKFANAADAAGTILLIHKEESGSSIDQYIDSESLPLEHITIPLGVSELLLTQPARLQEPDTETGSPPPSPDTGGDSTAEPTPPSRSEPMPIIVSGPEAAPSSGIEGSGDTPPDASVDPVDEDSLTEATPVKYDVSARAISDAALETESTPESRGDANGHDRPSNDTTQLDSETASSEVIQPAESLPTAAQPDLSAEAVRAAEITTKVDEVLSGFVGNEGPIRRIREMIQYALGNETKRLDSIGFFGPASTGKTELAKRIQRAMGLRLISLSNTTLRNADDLATKLKECAADLGTPLRRETTESGEQSLIAPHMLVFIDEVHLLAPRTQESLLTAMEPADRKLVSSLGNISTENITFVIATTDPGKLGDAFKSRVKRIDLSEYTETEIVEILKVHQENNTDMPTAVKDVDEHMLGLVARVGRLVPRKGIELLKEVGIGLDVYTRALEPNYEDLCRYFRERLDGVDEQGITNLDRKYLKLLYPDKTLGEEVLALQLGQAGANIRQDIEPYLMKQQLLERARPGRKLTRKGREYIKAYEA